MRRLILIVLSAVSALYAGAQRYDYDDIYFNPKTDLVVNEETADEMEEADEVTATPSASVAVAPEEEGGVSVSVLSGEPFEYSRRIQKFHTEQDTSGISPYIADTNYVNIFMLGDGSYRLNVDGNQVDIASYDGYDYGYWGYPYDPYWSYYDSWLWYRPWYSGYWGFRSMTRSIGDGVITITIGIITIIIGTMGITITMPTAGVMTGQRTKGAESTRATVCSAGEAAEPPIPRQHAVKTVRHQPPQCHRAAAPQRQLLREAQHPRPAHGARLLSLQRG